jgi:hypothetical protein
MSRPRARALALSVLLTCWLLAGSVAFAMPAAAATIEVDNTLAQTDTKGEVDVKTQVIIPDGATSVEITIPEDTDVYETEGFRQSATDGRTYEWTGGTDRPFVRYDLAGNRTIDRGSGEQFLYAVTDEWAVVRSPSISVRATGIDLRINRSNHVDGEGVAGRHITYLGGYEEHTRQAAGQRFRLIESEHGDMHENPEDVLDSLAHAANHFETGARDDSVLIIAVPSNVDWAATGVQRGDSDMWVRDDERLDTARNTWIHEYVHTRQDYDRTEATRWTIEGMADYYAALLTYEQGRIDFETFQSQMDDGARDRYSDVQLSDPATWENGRGNYEKGALVFGHLDRRLRADADTTLAAAIAEFNDPGTELTQQRFLDAVETTGSAAIRDDAERYTETTETPEVWSRQQHLDAFGGADIRYEFEGFAVSGPYREATIDSPRVVTDETLEPTVRIRNVGTESGEYTAELRVDGETVAERTGTLDADAETTVTFQRRFDAAGEYDLSVGTTTTTAVVEEPADVAVTDLTADPATAALGESVTLRATVASSADRPADGDVTFAVGGKSVATERVQLNDGSVTVEATTTFEESGEYTVTAGDRSTTVSVKEVTATPGGTESAMPQSTEQPADGSDRPTTPTEGAGSGFGVGAAALATLAAAVLFGRR